jgi:hypothetical protein
MLKDGLCVLTAPFDLLSSDSAVFMCAQGACILGVFFRLEWNEGLTKMIQGHRPGHYSECLDVLCKEWTVPGYNVPLIRNCLRSLATCVSQTFVCLGLEQ